MKLKVYQGIENFYFEYGVVPFIVLIRLFLTINNFKLTLKDCIHFNRLKLSYFC